MSKLVAANWKMHAVGAALAEEVQRRTAGLPAEVVVFPASPYLREVARTGIPVGGQDLYWEDHGAFTGAVSAAMLREVGCSHVIVGHSERRQLFGDTDASVARKVRAALDAGLTPVLCVGETLQERDAGYALRRIRSQVEAAFAPGCIVAYEPIWAIGTGRAASPGDAAQAVATIRSVAETRVLYGGSVNPTNCAGFFAVCDGALVGGASLDADKFAAIVAAAG